MALTIYKISNYVNWNAKSPSSYGGGEYGIPVDLSNYYTIQQLRKSVV